MLMAFGMRDFHAKRVKTTRLPPAAQPFLPDLPLFLVSSPMAPSLLESPGRISLAPGAWLGLGGGPQQSELNRDQLMKVSLPFICACALLCSLRPAAALEAISFYDGGLVVGYSKGGAGFAFSPENEIVITALASDSVVLDQQPCMVTLWDSNGLPLVSVLVTTNSPRSNLAHYEAIAPLPIAEGQMCYVSSVETNSGRWVGWLVGLRADETFTVGPGLSYIGSANGTNSDGTFPNFLDRTQHCLFVGANFLYVAGPLLTVSGLQVSSGQAQIGFGVSGAATNSFTLLESDQPAGPWTTNSTAVLTTNIPGAAYTFTTSPDKPARFYKIQTP
jgi:hypothetical protein